MIAADERPDGVGAPRYQRERAIWFLTMTAKWPTSRAPVANSWAKMKYMMGPWGLSGRRSLLMGPAGSMIHLTVWLSAAVANAISALL